MAKTRILKSNHCLVQQHVVPVPLVRAQHQVASVRASPLQLRLLFAVDNIHSTFVRSWKLNQKNQKHIFWKHVIITITSSRYCFNLMVETPFLAIKSLISLLGVPQAALTAVRRSASDMSGVHGYTPNTLPGWISHAADRYWNCGWCTSAMLGAYTSLKTSMCSSASAAVRNHNETFTMVNCALAGCCCCCA